MIKICAKVDKPTPTMNLAMLFHSLLKKELVQRNIIAEFVVSVDLSTFPLIFIILSDLPKSTFSPYIYIYMCVGGACVDVGVRER